jgi:hypothetical protein
MRRPPTKVASLCGLQSIWLGSDVAAVEALKFRTTGRGRHHPGPTFRAVRPTQVQLRDLFVCKHLVGYGLPIDFDTRIHTADWQEC